MTPAIPRVRFLHEYYHDHEAAPALDRIVKPDFHLHTSARPELHLLSGQASLEYVLGFLKTAVLS